MSKLTHYMRILWLILSVCFTASIEPLDSIRFTLALLLNLAMSIVSVMEGKQSVINKNK